MLGSPLDAPGCPELFLKARRAKGRLSLRYRMPATCRTRLARSGEVVPGSALANGDPPSKGGRGSNWRPEKVSLVRVGQWLQEKKGGQWALPCFCLKLRTSGAEGREEGRSELGKTKSTRAGKMAPGLLHRVLLEFCSGLKPLRCCKYLEGCMGESGGKKLEAKGWGGSRIGMGIG